MQVLLQSGRTRALGFAVTVTGRSVASGAAAMCATCAAAPGFSWNASTAAGGGAGLMGVITTARWASVVGNTATISDGWLPVS